MLVVTTIEITKGFQTWKDMVKASGEKMKEYGMTMVFAGPQADDETKLHAVIRFESMEALKKFQADEELTQRRIEAGVKVETGTFTIVSDESLLNYPTTISQHE
tara:strand:- start:24 stop:335 length:312 start_codon:yes stop_codon:yes gene_type:complete